MMKATEKNSTTQTWVIDGKPATPAEVARINAASKRAEKPAKTPATAAYEPKAFSLLR